MFDSSSVSPDPLRTEFSARAVRQGAVGYIAFIEEIPALMAWGSSREEAECNMKKRFAAFVARERSQGNLQSELVVRW
jgi:predicted RNase H-like HicB family nuclease